MAAMPRPACNWAPGLTAKHPDTLLQVCSIALGPEALEVAIDAKPVDGEVRRAPAHAAAVCT